MGSKYGSLMVSALDSGSSPREGTCSIHDWGGGGGGPTELHIALFQNHVSELFWLSQTKRSEGSHWKDIT